MARKPTPAGATPANTTPPAPATAPAAAPAVPAPAEAPSASPPADAADTDTSAAVSDTPPAAAADAADGATEGAPSDTPIADVDGDRDLLEVSDARVLVAFNEHLPDDIVSGTLAELRALERDGKVDTHPDAVAYVRSQQA